MLQEIVIELAVVKGTILNAIIEKLIPTRKANNEAIIILDGIKRNPSPSVRYIVITGNDPGAPQHPIT
jgi:hypothetical protein